MDYFWELLTRQKAQEIIQRYVFTYQHQEALSEICVVSSEFAAISLDNLQRSLAYGGRRNVPSRAELGVLLASNRVRSNFSNLKFSLPDCPTCLLQTGESSQEIPVQLPGGVVMSFQINAFDVKNTVSCHI